jgi:tetratricopeptide (TPR) repeat protein
LPNTPSDIVREPEQLVKPSVAKEIVPGNNRITISESKFSNKAKNSGLFDQLTMLVDKGDYNEANRLIDTLPDNEDRLVMLRRLIEHFPNNARLLAYLAIHYGKSKQTDLAIKAADLAIKISPSADEFLYYVKGRCLCLAAYDLMDEISDCEDLTPYKMAKIKEIVVQAGKQFEDCRRTETKSDHGYIVHIEMIIKALDFGYRTSGKSKISEFLMKDDEESLWYINLLLLANNLYDELKSLHGREEGTLFINKLSHLYKKLNSFTEALLIGSSQPFE